jgi:uncharacterized membrane protein YgaE (UPF0421/DUF939 family)
LAQATKRRPGWFTRVAHSVEDGLITAAAAILAYLPTQLLSFRQGFWSAITAIAIIQGSLRATERVARDQIAGGAIGGLVGCGMMLALGDVPSVPGYGAAIILTMMLCAAIGLGSAARVASVTCTILMIVPATGSPQSVLLMRVTEVGWGILVALGTAWFTNRLGRIFKRWRRPPEQIEGPEEYGTTPDA